jgi:very-short-patch-repair endonuclease
MQARIIDDLITQSIDLPARERHQIRVGKPAGFQGDERDVVLLSMVAEHPAKILTHPNDQRRFNVAASRARDQMWLFTSVKPEWLKRDDLRTSLIGYMQSQPAGLGYPHAGDLADVRPDRKHAAFDSLFEQQVYLRIRDRGYAVVPQVPVGAKRIDLVVYGAASRLAVECDGDYFHDAEQMHDDLLRERELVRVGWQFWRIRHSVFAEDPEAALAPLWVELAARGIEPGTHLPEPTDSAAATPWEPVALPAASSDVGDGTNEEEDGDDDEDEEMTA